MLLAQSHLLIKTLPRPLRQVRKNLRKMIDTLDLYESTEKWRLHLSNFVVIEIVQCVFEAKHLSSLAKQSNSRTDSRTMPTKEAYICIYSSLRKYSGCFAELCNLILAGNDDRLRSFQWVVVSR
jgi:hypothetical protein